MAIKIGGTTVIDDTRNVTNVANVAAASGTFSGASGVSLTSGPLSVPASGNTTGSTTSGINFNAAGSAYIFGTTGDTASATQSNLKIASWNGIGFASSITGQTVPQWENSMWVNVRNGAINCRADLIAYSSDIRLKENFVNIENALEKVKQLGGYEFDWKMEKCRGMGFEPNNVHEHGVKAQEVQQVVPDAVTLAPFDDDGNKNSKSGESYLTVKYERLVPLLIEAIKAQQEQIEELKRKIR
jgi:hypothetical protein